MMSAVSESRKSAAENLDNSLCESGGVKVFNAISALHVVSSVQELQKDIRLFTTPKAYPKNHVLNEDLLQRSVNKPAIAKWLGTALDILDRAVTQIQAATKLEAQIMHADGENKSLMQDKIEDQKTIIDLQQKLIEKKDSYIQCVRETVETEVQSYASVVKKTFEKVLAPENFERAVKKVKQSEDRARNIVIYGLKEEKDENLTSKVSSVLECLQEKPVFSIPQRIGVSDGNTRPVKLSFASSFLVSDVLRKSKLLRTNDDFKNVFIAADRTKEERAHRRKLVDELREKRNEHSDLKFVIRNGKVMQL